MLPSVLGAHVSTPVMRRGGYRALPLAALALIVSSAEVGDARDWRGVGNSKALAARSHHVEDPVDQRDTVLECYDGPFDDAAMEGCADGCKAYKTLALAEKDCSLRNDCNGISMIGASDRAFFEIRLGPQIIDAQGEKVWLKEERCLEGSATGAVPERDEEYQVGDEKEGQIEQEWTDALNKRYGLESQWDEPGDFDDDSKGNGSMILASAFGLVSFLLAIALLSYRRGHQRTVATWDWILRSMGAFPRTVTVSELAQGINHGNASLARLQAPSLSSSSPGGSRGNYSAL